MVIDVCLRLDRDNNDSFTIIIPTLNEKPTISKMLDMVTALYPQSTILIVDDSSTDGTPQKVLRYSMKNKRINLIERVGKERGLTASILDGILNTKTDFFVVMDADFQHPPEKIMDIVDSLKIGNDIVVGVRKNRCSLSLIRKISSWGAHALANFYLSLKRQSRTRDTMSGFFGGRTELCKEIIKRHGNKFELKGFKILFDLLKFAPKNISVGEVEFEFGERQGGKSKLSSRVVLSILRQCGIPGKITASVISFLLLNMLGRFLATFVLGTFSTVAFLSVLGDSFHISEIFPTVTSLVVAMVYLVIATELLFRGRRESLLDSARLIMIGAFGYLLTVYMVQLATSDVGLLEALSLLVGFGLAFSWDVIGCSLPSE